LKQKLFDPKKYAHQTHIRLIIGVMLIILIIGPLIVNAIYGRNAALSALMCMGGALIPIAVIFISLYLLDWVVKRRND